MAPASPNRHGFVEQTGSWPLRIVSRDTGAAELRRKIAAYEQTYELSSEEMLAALDRGERKDTADIAVRMTLFHSLRHLNR